MNAKVGKRPIAVGVACAVLAGTFLHSTLTAVALQPPAEEPKSDTCRVFGCTPGGIVDTGAAAIEKSGDDKPTGGAPKPPPSGDVNNPPPIPQPDKVEAGADKLVNKWQLADANRKLSEENAGYLHEYASIQVADASALQWLSKYCVDNDKPSHECWDGVSRANSVKGRMERLLENPAAKEYLATIKQAAWRPESPLRAAAVKFNDNETPTEKAERETAKAKAAMMFQRDPNGGFIGCEAQRAELLSTDGGAPSVQATDLEAAYLWDTDKVVVVLKQIQDAKAEKGYGNDYRMCALMRRYNELKGQSPGVMEQSAPKPAAAPVTAIDPFSIRRGQSDGSRMIGEATDTSQRPARLAQAQAEMNSLASTAKQMEDNALLNTLTGGLTLYASAAAEVERQRMLEAQADYEAALAQARSQPSMQPGYPNLPTQPMPNQQTAQCGPAGVAYFYGNPTCTGSSANRRTHNPANVATGCVQIQKNPGNWGSSAWFFVNMCGWPVEVVWDMNSQGRYTSQTTVGTGGHYPVGFATLPSPFPYFACKKRSEIGADLHSDNGRPICTGPAS